MSDWSSDVRPSYLLPPAPRRRRSRRSRGGRLRRPGAPSRRPGAGDSEFTRRSSPEGRARTKPSGRPEQPIAGVAEAGDDVGAVVEALVERRGHHVGDQARRVDAGDALRGGEHAHRCELAGAAPEEGAAGVRSEEHTSELQSLMPLSYAVSCFQKKTKS